MKTAELKLTSFHQAILDVLEETGQWYSTQGVIHLFGCMATRYRIRTMAGVLGHLKRLGVLQSKRVGGLALWQLGPVSDLLKEEGRL